MKDENTPNPDEPRGLFGPLHLINAMIQVRDEKGESFGTLLLLHSDIDEEIIARYGSSGYVQAHGGLGTKEDIFRFMADNFAIYESEFVGSLAFMLDINDENWQEAEHGFTFATRHFENHGMNEVPLNLILRFVRSNDDAEPPLDAALRRVFRNAFQSQFPVFADAFGIGDGFITLSRIEREFLNLMIFNYSVGFAKSLGVQTIEEIPVDEAIETLHTNIAGFLQENVSQERAPALFQKMNRIFPFLPESEDENTEEPQED